MTSSVPGSPRLQSIDIIRGAVMVLMAIDHVRVFSGVPPGGPDPAVFFTRWVTHFCAPAFVFFAGTSAYLSAHRVEAPRNLTGHLLIRGAWLVLLELTFIRFAWTFNFDYAHYLLAGVIWVIGWSMILMAGIVRLPIKAIAVFAVVVIVGHNMLGPQLLPMAQSSGGWILNVLYFGFTSDTPVMLGVNGPELVVLYSIFPWVAVMAAGYAFGTVMRLDPARRNRVCYRLGLGAVALFLALRAFDLYGDPAPWRMQEWMPAPLAFLNTTKYPASLLFLLMTLGPTIAAIPLLEHARGKIAGWLTVFGKVPFFYYLLHIPLIHAVAIVVSLFRSGAVSDWLFGNHPMRVAPPPEGDAWSLGLLYLVFAGVVVALYFPCRWFAEVKQRHKTGLISLL